MKIKIVFHLDTRWYYRQNVSSNGIFWLKQSQCQIKRSEKTYLLLENDAKMTIFFQDRLKCFWSCFPLGPVLPYSLHSIKLPKSSHFFSRVNHTKNLSNEGWTTWQWHVIDFFIIDQFVCKTIILGNFIRYWQLHIKNLSRKEIIVHTIVLP